MRQRSSHVIPPRTLPSVMNQHSRSNSGLRNHIIKYSSFKKDDYLTYSRAIELATQFKDCALEDEDLAYVIDNMDESEIEFFGLNDVESDIF